MKAARRRLLHLDDALHAHAHVGRADVPAGAGLGKWDLLGGADL